MKALRQRLTKAEAALRPPPRCPTCRQSDGDVVGDETGKRSRPEECPECGRVVPVQRLVIVVGLDFDRL